MKKLIFIIAIALTTTTILFAQETPFEKFDKSRIDVGTMYVYEYSKNEKDFKPSEKRYLYIKTLNSIEVMSVSFEDTLELPDVFKYTLNWDYMMLEKEDYKYLGNKNDLQIDQVDKRNDSVDFQKKTFTDKMLVRTKDGLLRNYYTAHKLESIPTYFYQITHLMPLWFALRFYPLNKKTITVNSMTNDYNTKFEIKYEGKEKVKVPFGKVLCYKFELVPQLSFLMKLFHSPKKVWIWLSAGNNYRYMTKYRNNNATSSYTQSMEYRLVKRKKISLKEWEQFKERQIAQRLKAKEKK